MYGPINGIGELMLLLKPLGLKLNWIYIIGKGKVHFMIFFIVKGMFKRIPNRDFAFLLSRAKAAEISQVINSILTVTVTLTTPKVDPQIRILPDVSYLFN